MEVVDMSFEETGTPRGEDTFGDPKMNAQEIRACEVLSQSALPYQLTWAPRGTWMTKGLEDGTFIPMSTGFLATGVIGENGPLDTFTLKRALAASFMAIGVRNAELTATKEGVWINGATMEAVTHMLRTLSPQEDKDTWTKFGGVFKTTLANVTGSKLDVISKRTQELLNGRLSFEMTDSFENTTSNGDVEQIGPGYIISKLASAEYNPQGNEKVQGDKFAQQVNSVDVKRSMWSALEALDLDVDVIAGVKRTQKGVWVSEDIINHMLQVPSQKLDDALAQAFAPSKKKER